MKVVEYWHGTIKNYSYDGDVSDTGALPQAWQLPRGVPIPMYLSLFLWRW